MIKSNPAVSVTVASVDTGAGRQGRAIVDDQKPSEPIVVLPKSLEEKNAARQNAWAKKLVVRDQKKTQVTGGSESRPTKKSDGNTSLDEKDFTEIAALLCEGLDLMAVLKPAMRAKLLEVKRVINNSLKMLPKFLGFLNKLNDG